MWCQLWAAGGDSSGWDCISAADDPSVSQSVFTITEKAPTRRTFSCLKAPTSAFTFKTLLRHYAKQTLTPQKVDVKLDADAIIKRDGQL